jgi:hypothetical protein
MSLVPACHLMVSKYYKCKVRKNNYLIAELDGSTPLTPIQNFSLGKYLLRVYVASTDLQLYPS